MVGREGSMCSRLVTSSLPPPAQTSTGAQPRRTQYIDADGRNVRRIAPALKQIITAVQTTATTMQKRVLSISSPPNLKVSYEVSGRAQRRVAFAPAGPRHFFAGCLNARPAVDVP